MRRRHWWRIAAAGGVLALLPASAAWAAGPSSTAASHTVSGTVTIPIGSFSLHARESAGKVSGSFTATGSLVPSPLTTLFPPATQLASFTFTGPVTCLDVSGGRVGLIYPIDQASGPVASAFKGQAVYITIQDNGPGQPEQVGFLGPAPLSSLTTCPALVPFLPVTAGHIAVDGR